MNTSKENWTHVSELPILEILTHSYLKPDDYWFYDVGIEIECSLLDGFFEDEVLEEIKSLHIYKDIQLSPKEQRFRLPKGGLGFYALHKLSDFMKKYYAFNDLSGIHYHIDFTDCFDNLINNESIINISPYLLNELDSWNYKGSYNPKIVKLDGGSCWVKFQTGFKTMEVRIGEMTFDYNLLLKRILHLQNIAYHLKFEHLQYLYSTDLVFEGIAQIVKKRLIKCH